MPCQSKVGMLGEVVCYSTSTPQHNAYWVWTMPSLTRKQVELGWIEENRAGDTQHKPHFATCQQDSEHDKKAHIIMLQYMPRGLDLCVYDSCPSPGQSALGVSPDHSDSWGVTAHRQMYWISLCWKSLQSCWHAWFLQEIEQATQSI